MKISSSIHFKSGQLSNNKQQTSLLTSSLNSCQENQEGKLPSKNVSFGSIFSLFNIVMASSPEKLFRQNYIKLARFFVRQKIINPNYVDAYESQISTLATLNYDDVVAKYNYCNEKMPLHGSSAIRIPQCFSILAESKLDLDGLSMLCKFAQQPGSQGNLDINELMQKAGQYEKFDNISTKEQVELISNLNKPSTLLSQKQIEELQNSKSLMQIPYFRDLYSLKSEEKIKESLLERQKNVLVKPITVDNQKFDSLFGSNGVFLYDNLKEAFKGVNLNKYYRGVPLKYPRENFVSDFNNLVKHLAPQDKSKVFAYYKFNIDEDDDIIGYPVPREVKEDDVPAGIKKELSAAGKLVNAFMLENKIELQECDRKLEDTLNTFIKAFPEFVSIIGKKHHRGDSIDNHTLADLQGCVENPMTKELTPLDQQLLFVATMFHDISKKENKIDREHPKYSAIYTKEIIKKLPVSPDSKERIYNLIKNSHWTTNGTSDEEAAAIFRRKNDMKLAIILSKADTESAGFKYPVSQERINRIYTFINDIYKNGIPLFADNLPDKKNIPFDKRGLRVIDFSADLSDVTEYGFKVGTKLSDLNFLCHSSTEKSDSLLSLCDDSKEICLSSILMNPSASKLLTQLNKGCNVILAASNSNICLAGSFVGSTGNKRGFNEFKQYLYGLSYEGAMLPDIGIQKFREELPSKLKNSLKVDDNEYAELYKELDSAVSVDDIQDIILSSGKVIKSSDIKKAIQDIIAYMNVPKKDKNNEVVVFNPKIQAFVIKKDSYNADEPDDETLATIKTAKENDIPVVLV